MIQDVYKRQAKTLGADGAVVAEEGYGNPDADFVGCLVVLEDAGVKTIGVTNECTGRNGTSQPLEMCIRDRPVHSKSSNSYHTLNTVCSLISVARASRATFVL